MNINVWLFVFNENKNNQMVVETRPVSCSEDVKTDYETFIIFQDHLNFK